MTLRGRDRIIGLPVPPEALRPDVWVSTPTPVAHCPCSESTLVAHFRGLVNAGLVVGHVPDARPNRPPADDWPALPTEADRQRATGENDDDQDRDRDLDRDGEGAATTPGSDSQTAYVPGWWRLTPAGCARLAALVDAGVAAVAEQQI